MLRCKYSKYIYTLIATIIVVAFFVLIHIISGKSSVIEDEVKGIFFSRESGFYEEEFDLSIWAPEGEVYYTLDGSDPTNESLKYEKPIHISDASSNENVYSNRTDVSTGFREDLLGYSVYSVPKEPVDKCTVVRAVVCHEDGSYSKVKTASYFVGFDDRHYYDKFNVVSITTDPDNLFGYEKGIYVTGKAFDELLESGLLDDDDYWAKPYWWWWESNYSHGKHEEVPASCQFYDTNHRLRLSQTCGVKIHGGGTRGVNPKSLNLYARKEYGPHDYFVSDFFGTGFYPKRVTLFNGGDNYNAKIKDVIVSDLCQGLDVATMDFVPYVLFLDGEYWGCYWLNEKYDEEYFSFHYGVFPEDVAVVKDDELECGEYADYVSYEDLYEFVEEHDMSNADNYKYFEERVDVDSFLDYYASLLWLSRCGDWPESNFALWKSKKIDNGKYYDGKWRYMIFDVNSGGIHADLVNYDSFENAVEQNEFFESLMNNKELKNKLLDRIEELNETTFSEDKIVTEMAYVHNILDEQMKINNERFWGDGAYEMYVADFYNVETFFLNRHNYIYEMTKIHRD